jgi:hypothetical protein
MMNDQNSYDALETPTLINLLIDATRPAESHIMALAALAKRSEGHRTPGLISTLESITRHSDKYDPQVMIGTIDGLATDPDVTATAAMLEFLPVVLRSVADGKGAFASEFRGRYYQALLTRQSDDDLEVWGEVLPKLDGRSLAGAILDPEAGPLEAIEPWTLLERLTEPERTKALVAVVVGVVRGLGSVEAVRRAVPQLRESHDPAELEAGLDTLGGYWEQAKKAGRDKLVANLEAILGALDRRPRTSVERLTGKRPWAK